MNALKDISELRDQLDGLNLLTYGEPGVLMNQVSYTAVPGYAYQLTLFYTLKDHDVQLKLFDTIIPSNFDFARNLNSYTIVDGSFTDLLERYSRMSMQAAHSQTQLFDVIGLAQKTVLPIRWVMSDIEKKRTQLIAAMTAAIISQDVPVVERIPTHRRYDHALQQVLKVMKRYSFKKSVKFTPERLAYLVRGWDSNEDYMGIVETAPMEMLDRAARTLLSDRYREFSIADASLKHGNRSNTVLR